MIRSNLLLDAPQRWEMTQVRIDLKDAQRIARAGGLTLDEDRVHGLTNTLTRAGPEFIYAVARGNDPDGAVVLRQLRRAIPGLDTAADALGLRAVPDDCPADGSLDPPVGEMGQQLRYALRCQAAMTARRAGPDDAGLPQRVHAAVSRVDELLDAQVELLVLVRDTAAQVEYRNTELARLHASRAAGARSKHSPLAAGGNEVGSHNIAHAVMGPAYIRHGAESGDLAFDQFLWRLWIVYVDLSGTLPGTSVGSAGGPHEGKAGGPFLRFCVESLSWLRTQVPDHLLDRDPKLQKALASTPEALRSRLQREINFGTMRRK